MEKVVTARKLYFCDHCVRRIEIGEEYTFGKDRGPTFDDNDNQIGIKYYHWRLCLRDDCDETEWSIDSCNNKCLRCNSHFKHPTLTKYCPECNDYLWDNDKDFKEYLKGQED